MLGVPVEEEELLEVTALLLEANQHQVKILPVPAGAGEGPSQTISVRRLDEPS